MRISGSELNVLSLPEIERIHASALRILEEMGMEIQNATLLQELGSIGLPVDLAQGRVRFPGAFVEKFIAEADKYDWSVAEPHLSVSAGVYLSLYMEPEAGKLLPWGEEQLAFYFWLARRLPNIGSAQMLGSRLPCPPELEPLYERYYCWKYGAGEGGSIHLDAICPKILELYLLRAKQMDKPLQDVFHGTVYLLPPLKLGEHEAYQLQYYRQHNIRVGIGSMHSLGGSAPVTLAGAVTLNLAEQLALRILDYAWFGIKKLHLGGSLAVMDMRTAQYRSAPVERPLTILMNAQLARYYGASFAAHACLTDAKQPSCEAGAQKALTAVPLLIAGGSMWLPAGLLSADQICSPVQMVLDDELVGALKRFTRNYEISDETIGLETILDAGPGGHYFDQEHTARYLRKEIWQPSIWQRTMLQPWLDGGSKLDVDLGREKVLQLRTEFEMEKPHFLSEDEEKEILGVIKFG